MPRLFIAIDVPDRYAPRLTELRDENIRARWTPFEQFHLTLRFIGDVEDDKVKAIEQNLKGIQTPSFVVHIEGLGAFPNPRRPRILYVSVHPEPQLMALQRNIEQTVRSLGFVPENKPFTPHITVARLKDNPPARVQAFMQEHVNFGLKPFQVEAYYLYKSTLRSSGAVHERLASFALP